jgi:hypothetical protein
MNRSEVIENLDKRVSSFLKEVESRTNIQVQFTTLKKSFVVAQYLFDPHSNSATVLLSADWEDVDIAHELMHMFLELVEGFAVLAWRKHIHKTEAIESAFGRVRTYVDDEIVHSHLMKKGFKVDGEVLKPQIFDNIYTEVPRLLINLKPRSEDGMSHLDKFGYGELCRSAFLVQAELIKKKYYKSLSNVHKKKLIQFIQAFRKYRSPEARKADEILKIFENNDITTLKGHKEILQSWAKKENLDRFVGPTVYSKIGPHYLLPWP